tara:strand:- start:1700 stop:2125 length:426 start_codon:yes stop_codon:yes gene_type:complete
MNNTAYKIENFDDVLVGIKEIDAQHTKCLELFNAIIDAKDEEMEFELKDLLIKLLEHWEMHFKYEEDLMEQYKYSGFDKHKEKHDNIMSNFSNSEEMYSRGFTYVIFLVRNNLNEWREEHIKHMDGEDKKLAEYLKSKGVT